MALFINDKHTHGGGGGGGGRFHWNQQALLRGKVLVFIK